MPETIDTTKVLHLTTTWNDDGETYHFASIDGGKWWLEVVNVPTQEDHETIQVLIDGTTNPDGTQTFPMMATRRYFESMSPSFTVSEIREANDS